MRVFVIIITLMIGTDLFAADLDRGAVPFQAEGVIVTTSPIRESPPHGILNLFVGKKIESTKQNTNVKIIGKKTYGGFTGTNIWYQVEKVNDLKATKDKPLWIYGGVEGKQPQIQITETIK